MDGFLPNATGGQMLPKWLHIPRKDGQPKQLLYSFSNGDALKQWVNDFREAFLLANISVSYNILFELYGSTTTTQLEPFELVNERTQEKLTLMNKASEYEWGSKWIMKRSRKGETAAIQWAYEDLANNLNRVTINLNAGKNCIGLLSPPADEAGQSIAEGRLNPGTREKFVAVCHMLKTGAKNHFPPSIIDQIPRVLSDRRTLLAELSRIFTAIADAIAWCRLPCSTFQKLFRQSHFATICAVFDLRVATQSPSSMMMISNGTVRHGQELSNVVDAMCLLPELLSAASAASIC
ncbi:hypothetical protein niasHT_027821 [Heterodera trifolii]|uniref:PH domain-containing protein n=1 Tax=Heterodera trifolii TaxID=157864 RepID=A0ABD2JSF7_9BILA